MKKILHLYFQLQTIGIINKLNYSISIPETFDVKFTK
jgi:hypothetical protein